jgi:hypothetical protein
VRQVEPGRPDLAALGEQTQPLRRHADRLHLLTEAVVDEQVVALALGDRVAVGALLLALALLEVAISQ